VTKAFFDGIARRYDRAYAPAAALTKERMRRVVELLPARARVLDLGVGTGRELPALLDAGMSPVGLDASREMLAICAKRARPIPLVEASFWERLPFDDRSFDATIALHGTLCHPPDEGALARLAAEIERVTRGLFIAEVPSMAWLDQLPALEDRRCVKTGDRTFVYEDRVARVRIEGQVLDEDAWRRTLSGFEVSFEPLGDIELRIVARALR
jgi:SAM-dependent methyltransferase